MQLVVLQQRNNNNMFPKQRGNNNKHNNLHSKNVVILLLLVCLALTRTPDLRKLTAVTNSEEMMPVSKRQRLADGCYNVFVDVGANIGVHTRFLYESFRYPRSGSAVIFNAHFGNERDNRDFCAFAFEPNPGHKERHLELQSAYKDMGWKYYPIFAGVSDQAGNLTFYHMHDEGNKEWGFNALQKNDARGGQEGVPETVPVLRLAEFLLDEIRDREMPSTVYGKYPRGPKVVMKMDIEGMEYVTLPDLVVSGALCTTVDFCFGEFHQQPYFFPMNRTETHGGLYLENAKKAIEFSDQMVRVLHSAQNCKTEYSTLDDESYLKDGKSFPKPFNHSL